MYDALMQDEIIKSGWIRPIDPEAVQEPDDIFPFALEGCSVGGELYGIPVFLCGNFLIYDKECEALALAEHLTDLADESEILVINSEKSSNRRQYAIETLADEKGEANPSVDDDMEETMGETMEESLELIDRLAIGAYKKVENDQVPLEYDAGSGLGYISFSESMRFLEKRIDGTGIKSISFSEGEDVPRLYIDVAAVAAGVEGERYEKCLELMNVMAEAEVLTDLSVQDGAPQYLLLSRKSTYQPLAEQFPLYLELEKLADDEKNCVILTP